MHLGRTENNTVPYHVAVRSIRVICQCSVHSSDNIVAHVLIVSNSLSKLFSFPVLCLVCNTVERKVIGVELVDTVITGENFNVFILSVNFEIMDNLTVVTICVVYDQLSFRCTGSQIVLVFRDYFIVIV